MDNSSIALLLASRPELISLAILVIGVIVARVASLAVGGVLNALDRRAARISTSETSVLSPDLIRVSRAFVFWLFLILAVSLALRVLGVDGISATLNTVIDFTPRILIAFSIVVAGHLLGLVASHLVARLDDSISTDSLAPRLVHSAIVAVAVVMGLQHVSVDISFVTRLLLILVGTVSAGLMLAFALGARQHVTNLMARRELSRLTIGETIRIDDVEGHIVEIHRTGVDIATERGVASIPAARFAATIVVRHAESDGNG